MKLIVFSAYLQISICIWANALPLDFSLIETENPEFDADGHELYQGDMILDEFQRDFIQGPSDSKKAIDNEKYRWPNAVVQYRIDKDALNVSGAIQRGMRVWEENSCVRFTQVGEIYGRPHVIFKSLGGCFGNVGRLYYSKKGQIISIGVGCERLGTVAHEIGHALGFYHEQSRPERDNYVLVIESNIYPTMRRNFNIETNVNDYNVTYDLGSVMHYGANAFSINGKNTLVPLDPYKHFTTGQRVKLSFADIKLANLMYNCSENCTYQKTCANGGFLDKNCRCVCPPGTSGLHCKGGRPTIDYGLTCGGPIFYSQAIRSPNFPRNYPKGSKCVWVATAPAGCRVRARFTHFETAERSEENKQCLSDNLELRTSNLHEGEKYCASELKGATITSESSTMVFVFASQTDSYKGFKIHIDFV